MRRTGIQYFSDDLVVPHDHRHPFTAPGYIGEGPTLSKYPSSCACVPVQHSCFIPDATVSVIKGKT